jgi:hypothetical protein
MAGRSIGASVATLLLGMSGPALAQGPSGPAEADRIRIAEAGRLADRLADRVWPGWGAADLRVLLVGDSAEFLIADRAPEAGFVPLGPDPVLDAGLWSRPRRFPPNLLATFPVGGVPTIVIGSAERTGKSSTAWVLTLLHEHFHQWQYARPDYQAGVARLDLARGDTTGRWMLEYPFPYDSPPVRRAMRGLAASLGSALDRRESDADALAEVIVWRDSLRARLAPADERYLEFQLWQEGVARFIEYASARAAERLEPPAAPFRNLPDYEPYGRTADGALAGLRRELQGLDPAADRRVAFYPLGAAMALLLERTRPEWKAQYTRRPFRLSDLLPDTR